MKKIFFVFLFLILPVFQVMLGAQDLRQRLAQAMQQKRANTYFEGVFSFLKDAKENPVELISLVVLFANDSSSAVRDFTGELYATIQKNSTEKEIAQLATAALCLQLSDSVSYVRSTAAVALQEIPAQDFPEEVKPLIIESLSAYGDLDEEQLLLIGYLGLPEAVDKLQQLKNDPAQENRIRWCCYLALARMGDAPSLEFILSATQKQGVNDRVVYNYFPDLVYTRQRKAFDYLVKELFDNTKNCNSPNPSVSKEMVCGYRIMEMLAPAVKDFPLKTTASGSIDTKNYDKALETARKWFHKHGADYVILTGKF